MPALARRRCFACRVRSKVGPKRSGIASRFASKASEVRRQLQSLVLPPGDAADPAEEPLPVTRWLRHIAARGPPPPQPSPGDSAGCYSSTARVAPSVAAVLQRRGLRAKRRRQVEEDKDEEEEVSVLGGACSEVFHGKRLAQVLRPAIEHQTRALAALEQNEAIRPMSIHTSVGHPCAAAAFVEALMPHAPWPRCEAEDWFVNFQVEGTSAVWAGVEILMHLQQARGAETRNLVAVAEASYHGPSTIALGAPPLRRWPGAPPSQGQVFYPRPPLPRRKLDAEAANDDLDGEHALHTFLASFDAFLAQHGDNLGVILFEPQWGSSNAGRPWPARALQEAVLRCKARGILVLCDEIMCGLGRHGCGTLFLSKALGLEPDAVTFGKAVGGGVYPLAGVLVRRGASILNEKKRAVVQSHTYAGSSELGFLTGRAVLEEVPKWFSHAARMGSVVQEALSSLSDGKHLCVQGQGLMWGGLFLEPDATKCQEILELFQNACSKHKVWPYFVRNGFMISPHMDVPEADLREALERLKLAWLDAISPATS